MPTIIHQIGLLCHFGEERREVDHKLLFLHSILVRAQKRTNNGIALLFSNTSLRVSTYIRGDNVVADCLSRKVGAVSVDVFDLKTIAKNKSPTMNYPNIESQTS